MKELPLSQGLYALVDDADYEYLSQWKWTAKRGSAGHTFYAFRWIRNSEIGKQAMLWMHRVILPAEGVRKPDHINGNGLDNQRCNLRLATPSENMHNRRKKNGSTSGYKGVSRDRGFWQAGICVGNKKRRLGRFATAQAAALAYDKAAEKEHGNFARLNFPTEQAA